MLTKEGLEFLLRITDYFNGHWEELVDPNNPGWSKKPINQVLLLLSAHTLAGGIADAEAQRQIHAAIEKAMADAAQRVVKSSS